MRHLFLDLDGTLTDPAPGIGACFVHTARALGHASITVADVRRFIGPPLREAFREILVTDDVVRIEEAVTIYRQRFASVGLFENSVYPGVHDTLARLRQVGYQLCVVASKAALYANRIVDHFGLRELLPHVYGAELSGERSTKAELVAHALELEAAGAHRVVDTLEDLITAAGSLLGPPRAR